MNIQVKRIRKWLSLVHWILDLNPLSYEFTSDFFQLLHMNVCNTYKVPVILVNR